jgi:hypothetical protein
MSSLKMALCGTALLVGATAAHAGTAVTIPNGHYYTNQIVLSLTPAGGAVQAACAAFYQSAGTTDTEITLVSTDLSTGKRRFDVRAAAPLAPGPGLGINHLSLVQGTGSTFTNEKGTVTIYADGREIIAGTYTATLTVIDAESAVATVTSTLPSPLGTGTCVSVTSLTFVHSAAY